MNTDSIATTAADIIWREAELIAERGWRGEGLDFEPDSAIRPDLATATMWAVHGHECLARDLTEQEADQVASVLDVIEERLGMDLITYEAKHAGSAATAVAWELGRLAWELEHETVDARG